MAGKRGSKAKGQGGTGLEVSLSRQTLFDAERACQYAPLAAATLPGLPGGAEHEGQHPAGFGLSVDFAPEGSQGTHKDPGCRLNTLELRGRMTTRSQLKGGEVRVAKALRVVGAGQLLGKPHFVTHAAGSPCVLLTSMAFPGPEMFGVSSRVRTRSRAPSHVLFET